MKEVCGRLRSENWDSPDINMEKSQTVLVVG